jgi:pullulanase
MFNTIPSWTGQISAGVKGSILATKSTSALADDWDSMFAYDPEQSVNYISAHDNFCLWDKIKKCSFDNAYGKRVDKFGMGIVFTSQGIPFMHGGDEMLRTKVYNSDWTYAHNSYNAPDNYNKYDWSWKSANSEVYDYYRNMIAIRRAHPGFRMTTWDMINSNVTSTTANSGQVVITSITGSANSDSWSKTLVIYNSGSDYTYSLSGSWKIAAQDENAAVGGTAVSGSIVCKGTSVTILYQ